MMKHPIALLSALLFFLGVFAQNSLFLPFDMEYEAIQQALKENPRIKIRPESDVNRITIDYDGGIFTYDFYFGRLYRIESHKVYTEEALAQRFYEGSLAYFDRLRPEKLFEETKANKAQHVIAAKGKVFQLSFDRLNGHNELKLSAKFIDHAPALEMSQYEYLAANPFEQVAKEIHTKRENLERRTFTSFKGSYK